MYTKPKPRAFNLILFVQFVFVVAIWCQLVPLIGTLVSIGHFGSTGAKFPLELLVQLEFSCNFGAIGNFLAIGTFLAIRTLVAFGTFVAI